MKVTKENINKISYYAGTKRLVNSCAGLLTSLLDDLDDLNWELAKRFGKSLYIDYQDYHNEYSPERVDPCPDYYGCFRLRWTDNETETVGELMTLEELDSTICILSNFVEELQEWV